jgi:serine/threonine-protein kinase
MSVPVVGQLLSHYRILEPVGAGGMGLVFRARDERLERDVALKVLPAGSLADEAARRRFRREALAASRLTHPGIATVFDFDSESDTDFLVMELVPGETLHQRLSRGALSEAEAVGFASQIAEALQAAHELGVVHCDLKPENVNVTPRGQVKILDFGLAQLLQRGRGTVESRDHSAHAGTLPYMAPEQFTGEPLDARTDVHALGVLLFEMSTGRRPFEATTHAALMYSVVNAPPTPPRQLKPDLSHALESVILKALEKRPERRYATAQALHEDLARLGSTEAVGAPADISSIAVLPLENLSGEAAEEFFADGMTEALIGNLAQVGALRVISRTSVMRYKGTRAPLIEIARALRVDAIVEGTVARAGTRVRINAQLIEAATDRHLWARSYEHDLDDVLALQAEVARTIAEEIRVRLTPSETERLSAARAVDPKAYDAYLRGRFQWNRRNAESLRRSIELFEEAIAIDPTYALAWTGLADSYNILGDMQAIAPSTTGPRAKAAARRALDLDSQLAEAHTSMAFQCMFNDWDWAAAEGEFRRAIELQPSYATAHQWYGEFLTMHGRLDDAEREARLAVELDPLSTVMAVSHGDVLFFSRKFDRALSVLYGARDVDPTFVQVHTDLGRLCTQIGRHDEAIASFHAAARLNGVEPDAVPGLAYAYARAGREADARRMLEVLEARRKERFVSPHGLAVVHLALGDRERAFEWLEQALAEHDTALVWLRVHPRLDPLRSDPRFVDIQKRVGLVG